MFFFNQKRDKTVILSLITNQSYYLFKKLALKVVIQQPHHQSSLVGPVCSCDWPLRQIYKFQPFRVPKNLYSYIRYSLKVSVLFQLKRNAGVNSSAEHFWSNHHENSHRLGQPLGCRLSRRKGRPPGSNLSSRHLRFSNLPSGQQLGFRPKSAAAVPPQLQQSAFPPISGSPE